MAGRRLTVMKSKAWIRLFGLLSVFMALQTPWGEAKELQDPSAGIQVMRYEDGRVSLETQAAPLKRVLKAFSDFAGVDVVSDGPIEGSVTVYLKDLAPDVAARKILRGKDISFLYSPLRPKSPSSGYRLVEIRLHISEEGGKGETITHARDQPPEESEQPEPIPTPPKKRERIPDEDLPEVLRGESAERLYFDILEGNREAADETLKALREALPEAGERIDEFVQVMEDARVEAEQEGIPLPDRFEVPNMMRLLNLDDIPAEANDDRQ